MRTCLTVAILTAALAAALSSDSVGALQGAPARRRVRVVSQPERRRSTHEKLDAVSRSSCSTRALRISRVSWRRAPSTRRLLSANAIRSVRVVSQLPRVRDDGSVVVMPASPSDRIGPLEEKIDGLDITL